MKRLIITSLCLFGVQMLFATNKDSAWYYFNKGLTEKQTGRMLEASKAFEAAVTYDGSNIDALLENANCYLQMHKPEKALACFVKVVEIQPAHPAATQWCAQLYFDFHQYEKAIEMAEGCSGWQYQSKIIGISNYWLEDFAGAETFLLKAVAQWPEDKEVNYTLARTYVDLEEYKKALPFFEKAVSQSESKNSWMNELAILYFTVDEYRKSADMFQKALDNGYPASNDFNENFGFASLYAGDYDKGEQLVNKVWQRKPTATDLLRDMAEILYKKGQTDRSLVYCQKLLEINPKDGKALYQAGLNFIKAGQKDRGQQMCDKAIEMDPSLENLRRKKEIM